MCKPLLHRRHTGNWGLRDYGNEPTIWGGDPVCAHEWGLHEIGFKNSTKGNAGSTTASDPNHAIGSRFDSSHQFCQKCGAWLGSFGLEPTPQLYVKHSVEIFGLVWDLLSDDGTLWINLGDSYAGSWGNYHPNSPPGKHGQRLKETARWNRPAYESQKFLPPTANCPGLKPKDLVGIPWRVALALQAAGWYLRSDIIWSKPNPMPESVTDRPTKSHEYIFLMSKNEKYYYDHEAIKEPCKNPEDDLRRISKATMNGKLTPTAERNGIRKSWKGSEFHDGKNLTNHPNVGKVRKPTGWDVSKGEGSHGSFHKEGRTQEVEYSTINTEKRNKRSVWTIATQPYPEAHFATFPPALIEPCILAGSRPGDIVLDPFFGSGTTGQVAEQLGRKWIGCELQTDYEALQKQRTAQTGMPL